MNQKTILFLIAIVISSCKTDKHDNNQITKDELREHIQYLASEKLAGRYPGTPGDKLTAEFILKDFRSNDLFLYDTNGLQTFEVSLGNKVSDNNSLTIDQYKAELQKEFVPFAFSSNDTLQSEVAFAGYGFKIETPEFTWNEYKNLDVNNKWVMILEGKPNLQKMRSPFRPHQRNRSKIMLAREMGAGGVLIVSEEKELTSPALKRGTLNIPVIHITRELADRILKPKNITVSELKHFYTDEEETHSFQVETTVSANIKLEEYIVQTHNILAEIKQPRERNDGKYIVIGAHYDHLGIGGAESGSRNPDTSAIHFGADDNASGVASMLEISEKLQSIQDSLTKNILFIAFGAEEQGLIGSNYFINHSEIDPSDIEAMINIDMVGRLREEKSLQVGGTGTSKQAEDLLKKHNERYNFKLGFSKEGYGPSDHSSFYSNNIPVFFFSTGPHLDYHTPQDKPSKINYTGLKEVSHFIYDVTKELAMDKTQLTFQEAGPKSKAKQMRHGEKLKVTLGIMPDFAGIVENGLRADLVIKGKPAYRAGMQKGDIIRAINGKKISDVYDYMERLSDLKPGQTITVEILRDSTQKVLMVQL